MDKVSKLIEHSNKVTEPKMIKVYEKAFLEYNKWCTEENLDMKQIKVLHAYAVLLSEKVKPTTLNTQISYIKNQLKRKNIIEFSKDQMKDIYGYINTLKADHEVKTPEPLTDEQMYSALDKLKNFGIELLMKIAMIICISGGLRISMCHGIEFSNITFYKDEGFYEITTNSKKRKKKNYDSGSIFHEFAINNDLGRGHNFKNYLDLYYSELDNSKIPLKGNFFKQWRKVRNTETYSWSNMNMSINTLGDFSKDISNIIGIQNWEECSSKLFKRTSLTQADLSTYKMNNCTITINNYYKVK